MRRTPSGVRGLKFAFAVLVKVRFDLSHPVRGAWIEILMLIRTAV